MPHILVLNSGSSSIKYELIDMTGPTTVASGLIERIGEDSSLVTHIAGDTEHVIDRPLADHREGFEAMAEAFEATTPVPEGVLTAVGHRVVHGGDFFSEPAIIDDAVKDAIRACIPLAPLHNPANLLGIEVAQQEYPDIPHVAVFDTAFHQTMPEAAYRYAIDRETADAHRVRRYGFHGTSHGFVSAAAATFLDLDTDAARVISLHLGNGASACAVRGGKSIDTSMGMTPLAGLVMGTRSGDVDPGVLLHLLRAGKSDDDLDALLNRDSGLKGLCGSNDLRVVHDAADAGDADAAAALDIYAHGVRHYIGAYLAELGGADAVVFTAGVGENDARMREHICQGLEDLGIELDSAANKQTRGPREPVDISTPGSRVRVLVVPTNEELEIAAQTLTTVG